MAEVLITLGIIGVVAAITLPTLVQNYRKHVLESQLQKFYSIMNQAVKLAENEYGDWHNWELSDENKFVDKYLKNYIQFADIKFSNGINYYYFTDGSVFFPFRPNYEEEFYYCPFGISKCDTNGKNRFAFAFNYTSRNGIKLANHKNPLEPYGWQTYGDINRIKNDPRMGCFAGDGHYCTEYIMLNGWKIPKDYPFKL